MTARLQLFLVAGTIIAFSATGCSTVAELVVDELIDAIVEEDDDPRGYLLATDFDSAWDALAASCQRLEIPVSQDYRAGEFWTEYFQLGRSSETYSFCTCDCDDYLRVDCFAALDIRVYNDKEGVWVEVDVGFDSMSCHLDGGEPYLPCISTGRLEEEIYANVHMFLNRWDALYDDE